MGKKCCFCDPAIKDERLIAEDDNFFVLPTFGQITDGGYLLVIPKYHISCLGAMDKIGVVQTMSWKDRLQTMLEEVGYGRGGMFEHGIVGQTVSHAHLHVVPWLPAEITDRVREDFPDSEIQELSSLRDLQILYGHKMEPYLFWQADDGKMFVCWNPPAKPEYLRLVMAEMIGRPERGSWRSMDRELDEEFINDTVVRLKKRLRRPFSHVWDLPELFFGHPINIYGSQMERELIWKIMDNFPMWSLVNPNLPQHDHAYLAMKRKQGSGMPYFYDQVLPSCKGGVFMPFRDGKFGAGVAAEAKALAVRGCPLWRIDHMGNISPWNPNDGSTILSVDDTRARVRGPNGFLPY